MLVAAFEQNPFLIATGHRSIQCEQLAKSLILGRPRESRSKSVSDGEPFTSFRETYGTRVNRSPARSAARSSVVSSVVPPSCGAPTPRGKFQRRVGVLGEQTQPWFRDWRPVRALPERRIGREEQRTVNRASFRSRRDRAAPWSAGSRKATVNRLVQRLTDNYDIAILAE